MAWDDYAAIASKELRDLLDGGCADEPSFQQLLERHPILVPGSYPGLPGGHNGVFPTSVISQPPLTGLDSKIPDFAIISYDSGTLYVTLVEIEEPTKPFATAKGYQSAKFTQAVSQLRDWKIWFANPLNSARFLNEYQIPTSLSADRAFVQRYVLVYGRRSDLKASKFAKRRSAAQQADEYFMTWDRLVPNGHYQDLLTIRLTPSGYSVLSVPPTTTLGPGSADHHSLLLDRDRAIDASQYLSATRKQFLKTRWPYWDTWIQNRDDLGTSWTRAHDAE